MRKLFIAGLMCGLALPVAALEPIKGNPNWSGFWNLGGGGGVTESNFLANIAELEIELGDDTIDSLSSPNDEVYALPVLGWQYAYSSDNDKTHLIMGNTQGNLLEFERDRIRSALAVGKACFVRGEVISVLGHPWFFELQHVEPGGLERFPVV